MKLLPLDAVVLLACMLEALGANHGQFEHEIDRPLIRRGQRWFEC